MLQIVTLFLWRISDKHSGKCPSLTTNRVRGDHWRCPRKNRTSGPDGIWRLAHGAATASAHPSVVNYHGMPVSREEPLLYRTRVGAILLGPRLGPTTPGFMQLFPGLTLPNQRLGRKVTTE